MKRQEANVALLSELQYLIFKYPEQRFSQILLNFGFVKAEGEYYLEGEKLLERVEKTIKEIEEEIK